MKLQATKILTALTMMLTPIPAVASAPPSADAHCIATAMYHEARGEPLRGQIAVGYVVLNRVHSRRFRSSPCGVVYQRAQFTNIRRTVIPEKHRNKYYTLASDLIRTYSRQSDPTRGALFFHSTSMRSPWRTLTRTVTISRHVFYR